VGKTALVRLGRHDPDIVGKGAGDTLEDREALGVDAVVIGQENAHRYPCPQAAFSIFLMPPI